MLVLPIDADWPMIVELSSIYSKIHWRFIAVGHKYKGRGSDKGGCTQFGGRINKASNKLFLPRVCCTVLGVYASIVAKWVRRASIGISWWKA
jgi:hypothetical protein